MTMQWQEGKPQIPGWYWFKDELTGEWITYVYQPLGEMGLRVTDCVYDLDHSLADHVATHFAGPIPHPQ